MAPSDPTPLLLATIYKRMAWLDNLPLHLSAFENENHNTAHTVVNALQKAHHYRVLSTKVFPGFENGRLKCSTAVCVSAMWWNISQLHSQNLGKNSSDWLCMYTYPGSFRSSADNFLETWLIPRIGLVNTDLQCGRGKTRSRNLVWGQNSRRGQCYLLPRFCSFVRRDLMASLIMAAVDREWLNAEEI